MSQQPAPGEIRQVLVHPVVWGALELWLATQGVELNLMTPGAELPTYSMSPMQWVIDAELRAAPCSAGLLPVGAKAVEPCVTRGPHLMHRSASGESWPVEDDEE